MSKGDSEKNYKDSRNMKYGSYQMALQVCPPWTCGYALLLSYNFIKTIIHANADISCHEFAVQE